MDDHLAKPCSRMQLGSVMARRLPATPVDRRSEPAPSQPTSLQATATAAPRSLSGLGIVGCETASAVHFLPAFCPIAGLWACKSGKNCPRWGRFSLSTPQARQTPSDAIGAQAGSPGALVLDDKAPANLHALDEEGQTAVLGEVNGIYLDEAPQHLSTLRSPQQAGDGATGWRPLP